MGKKKRLNRFISKWIKSDLPEERSTVLLLGVTRIPTSPVPPRRPCSLPLTSNPLSVGAPRRSTRRRGSSQHSTPFGDRPKRTSSNDATPNSPLEACPNSSHPNNKTPSNPAMDRSVDSIGTCSLDMDASAELSDWSENTSVGTLRSVSLLSPAAPQETARLPSYLSLACTVNGYCTTTNYDPDRLAKSRDPSPHRPHEHAPDSLTYAIQNNLLSPPNLVPLPMQKFNLHNMAEQTITHHHQEFYTSSKSVSSFMGKESRSFTSSLFSKDTVDACLDSKFRNGVHNKQQNHEPKTAQQNGQSKIFSETVHEMKNGAETKSFIQQRVERLYGPGALAQGFFVMKRQKSRASESETDRRKITIDDKHSKSMSDKLLEDDICESNLRQCTSSPSLPVLRHLTPEFRAQLPIFSPRKGGDSSLQKSSTVPILKDEVNGHVDLAVENGNKPHLNGCHLENKPTNRSEINGTDTKDGHYFLRILETETNRLLALADKAEKELDTENLTEDIKGYIRSVFGKARLLVSQKMQQFKGLCTNNITQVEGVAFPTTNEDLQGFWDMVMLQVDQVDALFKELETLKLNNWIETNKTEDAVDRPTSNNNGKPRKVLVPRAQSAGAEEARKKREALRKQMLEDRRKAMRQQKQLPRQCIEIYMPESS